ncbi:MAG: hypothetical protein ACMUIG_01225 [Thermoplasmatota archaeon]
MAEIPLIVYIILLAVVIISPIMAQISKYSWKSRLWTGIFVATGVLSMIAFLIILLFV